MAVADLVALSLSARHAPFDLREAFALMPEDLAPLAERLGSCTIEALPLSTCHRFELYVRLRPAVEIDHLLALLAEARGADPNRLRAHIRVLAGRDAAEHLLRVAAGLDSPVLGETQILGQLRRALEAARTHGLLGHQLGGLVQRAITTGKRVQEETSLGRGALSVSRVAVDQARRDLHGLTDRTVLIVGAGETGQLAAKALGPTGQVLIVNRTAARARVLAAQVGGTALPLSELPQVLPLADVVICAVSAARPMVTGDQVAAAIQRRGDRPMVVLDLALPRSVEPSVGGLPGVRLLTLDDFAARRSAHVAERAREVPRAEAIVVDELERAWHAWAEFQAHDLLVTLRHRAEAVRQAELERAGRVLTDLAPEQQGAIQALTRAIVNKLLHQPTVWLKDHPAAGPVVLQEIFGLRVPA